MTFAHGLRSFNLYTQPSRALGASLSFISRQILRMVTTPTPGFEPEELTSDQLRSVQGRYHDGKPHDRESSIGSVHFCVGDVWDCAG